jgi:hypothetical protein
LTGGIEEMGRCVVSDRVCGCGEVYGVGLAVCPRCRRDPNEGMAVSVANECDRLTAENERLKEELEAHRKHLEEITSNGTEYDENWDLLMKLGLIVEAPPTQDFIDEWGDESGMWVLAWGELGREEIARRALAKIEADDGPEVKP